MSQAKSTTNHDEIRRWVESRKGHPAFVKSTRKGDSGLLRIDFGEPEEGFDEISWDEFFDTFEQSNLAFLYQDETSNGSKSRFNKFVSRDSEQSASNEDEDDSDVDEDEDDDELSAAEEADEDDADEDWEEDDEDEDEDEDLDEDDDDDDDIDEEEEEEEEEEETKGKGRRR
ncbi:MAG: hypothetical protein ACJ8MR_03025 [Povalibacter sp.]